MLDIHKATSSSVIAVQEVDKAKASQYGIVKLASANATEIGGVVEKPTPEQAPSNLAIVGRYILSPAIFELLEATQAGAGNEIQLTDAIAQLLQQERVDICKFTGKRYDCGNKAGYVQAFIDYAEPVYPYR